MCKNEKINILFILPNFDTGGSEKLVIDIIKHLNKQIFRPVLAVFFTGCYEKEFLKLKIPFYVIHKDRIRSKYSTFRYLQDILKINRISVVNTHHTSPLIQGLLPFKIFGKAALVHTEHTRLEQDKNISSQILFLEKIFLKKVDAVIGISRDMCEYYENELGVSRRKINMILNGVDLDRFHISGFNIEACRENNKYADDDIIIGTFANFREQKNHRNLIKAAKILKEKGVAKIKFMLCGSGPLESELKTLVHELGLENTIIFMGVRLDTPELMNMLDIYCLPSHYEGLPLSLLEAMASERPVVATNVPGNRDVVVHRETGFLVKPDSPEDLATGISELILDDKLREYIARKGYEKAREYSFKDMMNKYEKLFEEMYRCNLK